MRKFYIGLPLVLLIASNSFAQRIDTLYNAEQSLVKKYINLAEKSFEDRDFTRSILYHQKLDSLTPGLPEIRYNIGICYLNSRQKTKALPYLVYAKEKNLANKDLNFYLAQAYAHDHLFEEAKSSYREYLTVLKNDSALDPATMQDVNRRIQVCDFAKDIIEDSIRVEIDNAGAKINTAYDEYVPVVTADQQSMYFTSRRPTELNQELYQDGKHYEDIHKSEKDSMGNWKQAQTVTYPVNGSHHDACIGISSDGQTLFLYRVKTDSPNEGSIYVSKLAGTSWSDPEKLGTQVNTKQGWESSVSITGDNKKLFFSSDRPGGFGGLDIWYCDLLPTNEWSEPKNLGSAINTQFNEDCPYIHFDNKTLFFSSDGHKTMGGYDVFFSLYNQDNAAWATPINIGYPINTTDDDMYFVYSSDGSKGYMSSSKRADTFGGSDIYVINRPKHEKSAITLSGYVLDEETSHPVASTITVTDLEKKAVIGTYASNPTTGKYSLELDHGKNYSVQFDAHKYLFHSENVNIKNPEAIFVDHRTFKLKKLKRGSTIVLNNIFYEYNSYDLKGESAVELDKLLSFMKNHPRLHIEIGGHTDSIGDDAYNNRLSRKRANEVSAYLLAKGVPKKCLKIHGYGENNPISANNTEEGRRKNRRTEFKIYNIDTLTSEHKEYLAKLDTVTNTSDIVLEGLVPNKKVGEVLYPQVRFLPNDGVTLDDVSKKQLSKVSEALKRIPNMKLQIHGFPEKAMPMAKSKALYDKRVNTVLQYFVAQGFSAERFVVKPYQDAPQPTLHDMTAANTERRKVKFVLLDY